jgi:hypothetical protein
LARNPIPVFRSMKTVSHRGHRGHRVGSLLLCVLCGYSFM